MALVAGLIIGRLVAKIYFLKKKLIVQQNVLKKKHDDLQVYMGNIVHDLRSPIAAINMIAELLESDLNGIEPSKMELISSMRVSSRTMLDRICTILDNSSANQSKQYENLQAGNPAELINEVINKLHILAIEKNISIIMKLNNDLPQVYFDKDALDRIFTNLLSNAIKYSLPNTIITIYNQLDRDQVTFCVKDRGLGMNTDDLSKVFGKYAKLSAQPTAGEDSTGLGLSIVKELVEKMHGQVKAQSAGKGKGSTFSVSLSTNTKSERISA